jgi:hypothetical protein
MRNAPALLHGALLFGALLSVPFAVHAHDTPSPPGCSNPQSIPLVIGNFNFTAAQLQQYSLVASPPTNCGIVDEWHWARQMAQQYCAALPNSGGSAAPTVNQPSSFNHQNLHHALYRFSNGLAGSCVICLPPLESD